MSLSAIPPDAQITDGTGRLTYSWQTFMESISFWLTPVGSSGSTTNRPVSSGRRQLYIGQSYFDTTLSKPIWVQSLNPTVWADATGTPV